MAFLSPSPFSLVPSSSSSSPGIHAPYLLPRLALCPPLLHPASFQRGSYGLSLAQTRRNNMVRMMLGESNNSSGGNSSSSSSSSSNSSSGSTSDKTTQGAPAAAAAPPRVMPSAEEIAAAVRKAAAMAKAAKDKEKEMEKVKGEGEVLEKEGRDEKIVEGTGAAEEEEDGGHVRACTAITSLEQFDQVVGMTRQDDQDKERQVPSNSVLACFNSSIVVVDYHASWCRKCIYMMPKFRRLADELSTHEAENQNQTGSQVSVRFYTVDVNKVAKVPQKQDIKRLPTFIIYKNGVRYLALEGGANPATVQTQLKLEIQKLKTQLETEESNKER